MKQTYSKSIIASYATFKELYNSKKFHSPYQILSEFIKSIISSDSLYSFTTTDIQSRLKDVFGFDPPIAVITTALKSIKEVKRTDKAYKVTEIHKNTVFMDLCHKSEEKSSFITNELIKFADQKGITNLDKKTLSQEFIAFVLDEEGIPKYQQIIGEFILKNENNLELKNTISAIREGSILYAGLAFNISEFGSINKPITLFLDTEIIFDIIGLNGVLFKTLADDFLKLVAEANHVEKVITLKYFEKVEDDINQFYSGAEKIVSGQSEINFNQAMKEIVVGCKSISDVSDKRVDMLRKLRLEHSITKDEKSNYYTDYDNQFDLEKMNLPDYPECEENTEGYMFCSHINKLRKGFQTIDYLSSKFLCITDTRRVRDISAAIAESLKNQNSGEKYCDYAISLSHITNLLWYKMNRGFGSNEFPKNLDIVIKARTILSGYITQDITSTYKDIQEKVASGELTKEQAAARVIALKGKTTLPEDLDPKNIEDSLDFSDSYFSNFEETIAQNKRLLNDKDKEIEELTKKIKDLNDQLSDSKIKEKDNQTKIDKLNKRVLAIEEQEQIKEKKKERCKRIIYFIWSLIWKTVAIFGTVFVIWIVCRFFSVDFPTWLGIAISATGLVGLIINIIKRDIKRLKM